MRNPPRVITKRDKREDTGTQRRSFYDYRGRGCSDGSTSQGKPRIENHHPRLGERLGMDSPSEPPEEPNPDAGALISEFWPPEL